MRFLLLLMFILTGKIISAQIIVTSAPQKVTNKTPKVAVIGKNSQGILIRKFGNDLDLIECYDENLNLNWREPVIPKDGAADIYKMIPLDDNILVFYVKETKKSNTISGQILNATATPLGEEIFIDSLPLNYGELKIQLTDYKNQLLIQYQDEEAAGTMIGLILLNLNLTIVQKSLVVISSDKKIPIQSVFVDSTDFFNVITMPEEKAKDEELKKYSLTHINTKNGVQSVFPIDLDEMPYEDVRFDFDKVNNNLAISGFFTLNEDNGAEGYFYEIFDLDSSRVTSKKFTKFTDEFILSLTGKENSKKNPGLYSFDVKDVILRYDGGAIIVAESVYKSSEQSDANVFVSPTSPGFKSVIYYYYNDVIVLSLNPEGNEDWRSIIRKKQVSQDDKGFYSSFAIVNTNTDLHFVFNEDISRSANVFDHSVNSEGDLEKQMLFNSEDEGLFLAPQMGKQVSRNSIIIPSIRKDYLTFVKISY